MVELLPEMLRESERVVDQQMKVLEELDDKSEQLLALGLATLGGSLAVATLAVGEAGLASLARSLLVAAALTNLAALVCFLHPYVGLFRRSDAFAGPAPGWLRQKANDAEWSADRHLVALVGSYADWYEHNAALIAHHRASHRLGLLLLMVAVLATVGAFIYLGDP